MEMYSYGPQASTCSFTEVCWKMNNQREKARPGHGGAGMGELSHTG